ncbi:hypothetical protein [Nocardioides sp. LHG3406-4]|uniref:hypothetical protein n=1 Tax=Nocardioides sp. LHG3406-4 TaxID=2804575 RepID=UPI003CED8D06
MKSWSLMALLAVVFCAVGIGLAIGAWQSGELALWGGAAIFVVVGLVPAALLPRARREQRQGSGVLAPASATEGAPPPDGATWTLTQVADELSRQFEGTPYVVHASPERIRIHADLADATFLDFAGVNKVKVVRGLDIVPNGDGLAVVRDWEQDLDLTAGVGRLTGSTRMFSGSKIGFERRIRWGVGADGDWRRQVDFSSSSRQLRGVAVDVLKRAGMYPGWYATLPADAKAGLIVGLIGASAIPLVPLALLVAYLVK